VTEFYATKNYCIDHGWIPIEDARQNKRGNPLCPHCRNQLRTKSRRKKYKKKVWRFGK